VLCPVLKYTIIYLTGKFYYYNHLYIYFEMKQLLYYTLFVNINILLTSLKQIITTGIIL